jgi:hypothetical protein
VAKAGGEGGKGARARVWSRGEWRKEGAGGGRQLLKQRRGEAWEGGSARACHAVEGEGDKGGGVGSRTAGSGWLRAALLEAAARARGGGGLANRGGRRGAADAVRARLTGGAGQQWGPVVSGGCGREKSSGDEATTGRPGRHGAERREFKMDLKQNPNSNASNNFKQLQTLVD